MTSLKSEYIETCYKYCIKNAYLHNGKSQIGAVIGKLIALYNKPAKESLFTAFIVDRLSI